MNDKKSQCVVVELDGMNELSEKARELADVAEKACKLASEIGKIELKAKIRSNR